MKCNECRKCDSFKCGDTVMQSEYYLERFGYTFHGIIVTEITDYRGVIVNTQYGQMLFFEHCYHHLRHKTCPNIVQYDESFHELLESGV